MKSSSRALRSTSRRTGLVVMVIGLALASSVLAGCDVAKVGRRCSSGFARDTTHVLICQNGRWAKWKTFREYLLWLQSMQATPTTSTTTPSTTSTTTTSEAPGGSTSDIGSSTTTTTLPTDDEVYGRLLGVDGAEPNAPVQVDSVSADGRFVSFTSFASNLVPGDTTGVGASGYLATITDVFVWDRVADTVERQPLGINGLEPNYLSRDSDISADGRFVTFLSYALNLVPGNPPSFGALFVWDRVTDTYERNPLGVGGAETQGIEHDPTISADGRYVAFTTNGNNLRPGDSAIDKLQFGDIYIWDRVTDTYERMDVQLPGISIYFENGAPSISDDGQRVAFAAGEYIIQGPTVPFGTAAAFVGVWDRSAHTVTRQPLGVGGVEPEHGSLAPHISGDGTTVAFESSATNLVAGDDNASTDVFTWDLASGTVSRQPTDGWPTTTDAEQGRVVGISDDGRLVAIVHSHQPVGSTTWFDPELGVWDREDDSVTVQPDGVHGARPAANTLTAVMSGNGSAILLSTDDTTLTNGDGNGKVDLYAWAID